MPILAKWGKGPVLMYTETDQLDYPGMYVRSGGAGAYDAIFPKVPATHFKVLDRWVMPVFTKKHIAKTTGKRSFPWRVFMVADDEAKLLDSQLPCYLPKNMTRWNPLIG
jgi:alpha-glucosidase